MNARAFIPTLTALAAGLLTGFLLGGGKTTPLPGGTPAAGAAPPPSAVPVAIASIAGNSDSIARVFTALHDAEMGEESRLYEAIQRLSPEEMEKLRGTLRRLPSRVAALLRPALAERWALLHPAEAALRVRELPDSARFSDPEGIASAWAQANPALALAEAARLGARSGKASLLRRTAIWKLAQTTPALAMDHAEAMRDGAEKDSLMTTAATELARKNPGAASAWIASRLPKMKIGADGSALVDRMLAAMARKDEARAKAEVASLPDLLRKSAARSVGGELVAQNVRPGLEWCAENGVLAGDEFSQSSAFSTAIARDRDTAIAWTLEQPAGATRDICLGQLVPAAKSADEAVRYFSAMSAEAQKENAGELVEAYGEHAGFEQTAAWVGGIKDDEMRSIALQSFVMEQAAKNPEKIIPWIERMPAGADRDRGVMSVMLRDLTGISDPKNDGKLLGLVSSPENREVMAAWAYRNRSEGDESKSAAWLDALPGFTPEQKAAIKKTAREKFDQ